MLTAVFGQVEHMSHSFLLRAQIPDVMRGRVSRQRDSADQFEAVTVKAAVLGWVVGHQSNAADTDIGEYLGSDPVAA